MDAESIKVECLKLIAEKMPHADAPQMIKGADALYRWVIALPDQSLAPPEGTGDRS